MAKKNNNKQEYGDIIQNHDLIKRTLMASAYPALIKSVVKDGDTFFEGFLPGFEFATIEDIEDENEIVEYLQDMLDDEVEELVVFGKSLPYVEEDEKLLEKYPDYKIVLLDINVYATKEELNYYDSCSHNCNSCSHNCEEEEFYDDEFDFCEDEECDCHHHLGEECDCHHHHTEEDEDGLDEKCSCHHNEKQSDCGCNHNEEDSNCSCHHNDDNHSCDCKENKAHKTSCKCNENKEHNKTCKKNGENKKSCNCKKSEKKDN